MIKYLKNVVVLSGFLLAAYIPLVTASVEPSTLQSRLEEIGKDGNLEALVKTLEESMRKILQKANPEKVHNAQDEIEVFWQSVNTNLSHYYVSSSVTDFTRASWDVYTKFVRAEAKINGPYLNIDETYSTMGFQQGVLPQTIVNNIQQSWQKAHVIPMMGEDCLKGYATYIGLNQFEDYFNTNHKYLMIEDDQKEVLQQIVKALKDPIADCLGSSWKVVNVRSWKTHPRKMQHDSNGGWHRDGFPYSAVKIMIYPYGVDYDKGTTEFVCNGENDHVKGPPGTWFIFKNSEIDHRSIAPKMCSGAEDRLIIELTIVPSLAFSSEVICAGLNAQWPFEPWYKPAPQAILSDSYVKGVSLGRCLSVPGWVNLEAATSPYNQEPFLLAPNCRFPFANDTLDIVYTSHSMQYFNTLIVARVISEAKRVVNKGGLFVIKIPDYDLALDCWRNKDMSFFEINDWAFPTYTWFNRNIEDSLDHRAAMIFYSFATPEFGPLFSGRETDHIPGAYFGPPAVSDAFLRDLIKSRTPSEIALELRKIVMSKEPRAQICCQSAWSSKELEALLTSYDWEVVSFDKDWIIQQCNYIPSIEVMKKHSLYCLARKK